MANIAESNLKRATPDAIREELLDGLVAAFALEYPNESLNQARETYCTLSYKDQAKYQVAILGFGEHPQPQGIQAVMEYVGRWLQTVLPSDFKPDGLWYAACHVVTIPTHMLENVLTQPSYVRFHKVHRKRPTAPNSFYSPERESRDHFLRRWEKYVDEVDAWYENLIPVPYMEHRDRNLRWLAQRIAGKLSIEKISKREDVDKKTVSEATEKCAKTLGISIPNLPAGRPKK